MTANLRFSQSADADKFLTQDSPAISSFEEIVSRYRFPRELSGKGECIAIPAFGGGVHAADMERFFKQQVGIVADLHFELLGRANSPNLNSRHDKEVALDIQLAGGLAPAARIVTYFSTNEETGWIDTISRAIHDDTNCPTILSISWGATEDCWSDRGLKTLNSLFEEAAAMGITVCAASGDDGCSWDANGHCRVTFPASSPFVLACGGTTAQSDDDEAVWNVRNTSASGGGISDRIVRPTWQRPPSQLLGSFLPPRRNPNFDGRQLPDVSALASHGYSPYVGGNYHNGAGGTSAVAPIWSALIARINEGLRSLGQRRVGHFHPLLYQNQSIQQCFREVVHGHNDPFGKNGYAARSGWNPCSGWGIPDGERLLASIVRLSIPDKLHS